MKNFSTLKNKGMIVMKNISTFVLGIGALILILSFFFLVVGYDKVGLIFWEILISSVTFMFIGVLGEDLFDSILYG